MHVKELKFQCGVLIVLLLILTSVGCRRPDEVWKSPYAPQNGLAVDVFLLPLPPGAVRPKGWIETRAEDAARGLTGSLSKYASPFNLGGWGNDNMEPQREPFTAWWPYEQNGYYHDGLVRLGHVLGDSVLLRKYQEVIESVIRRNDNGYFYKRNSIEDDGTVYDHRRLWATGHNETDFHQWRVSGHSGIHWSHGTFLRSVMAHYKATRDDRLMDLMISYLDRYPRYRRTPRSADFVGAEMLWDLKLAVLETAAEVYMEGRGDSTLREKIVQIAEGYESGMVDTWARQGDTEGTIITHGVAFQEIAKMYAIFYLLTGKEEYLKTTLTAFDRVETDHMLPHGVYSSGEFLRGTGAFQYTETCNVAGWLWSNVWMARITGQGAYGDNIEKIFFNAEPGAISSDYRTHVYFQAPNRLPGVHLGYDILDRHHVKPMFKALHEPKCCSGNLTRILPNYVAHQWMATADGGLAAFLYGPSEVEAVVRGDRKVRIHSDTQYPFSETMEFTVQPQTAVHCPLYFRIPGWCSEYDVWLNGNKMTEPAVRDDFVVVERTWKQGDKIRLKLHMQVHVGEGVEKELTLDGKRTFLVDFPEQEKYRSDYKMSEKGPFAYVQRGPLVYSYAVDDSLDHNLAVGDLKYNMALLWNAENPAGSFEVQEHEIGPDWRWSYARPPVEISANVQYFDWDGFDNLDPSLPIAPVVVDPRRQGTINLVPYGSARFRMTMFAVVETNKKANQ